jgi:hypothetical protein
VFKFAFINNSDKALELAFKTDNNVDWDMLSTKEDGPAHEAVEKYAAGTWSAKLEPGIVYGFHIENEPTFDADDSITVLRAQGKDPWPKPPPPPPPPYKGITDFKKHLNRFFAAAS